MTLVVLLNPSLASMLSCAHISQIIDSAEFVASDATNCCFLSIQR